MPKRHYRNMFGLPACNQLGALVLTNSRRHITCRKCRAVCGHITWCSVSPALCCGASKETD